MEQSIVLAGGCFWCLEAIFIRVKGVDSVQSGYAGGQTENPTYEQVCTGRTGHAEVVKITYNTDVVSLHDIMTLFFILHDPTTLNRQGNDVGTQYRSMVFYANETEKQTALQVMQEVADTWKAPIVTKVVSLESFYPAEEYHTRYFENHPDQAYCQFVIQPKVSKLRKKFAHLLVAEG